MCLCCEHPQRTAIDLCIVSGQSERHVERQFGLTKGAVGRHKKCLRAAAPIKPAAVLAYPTGEQVAIAERVSQSIIQRVSSLADVLEQQATECANDKDRRNMTTTATALLKALELNARLTGELSPNQTNIQVNNLPSMRDSPEWSIFIRIVERHPQVKAELAAALQESGL